MDITGGFFEVDELVSVVCLQCGIPRLRHDLNDEEIARVCRWIGEHAPNTTTVDGKLAISAEGFDAMIFLTITEFPQFFEKHKLAMVWRN